MTDPKIRLGTDPLGFKVAGFDKGEIHLTVLPHLILERGSYVSNGVSVFFWGDGKGQENLNSIVLQGTEADIEEIADTYARRLESGVEIEHMFDDIIEKNREQMADLKTS